MEIRTLRAFVAVVEEGGLSAAARRLHLSQPALSQSMGALERELGVQLLVRSSTGVQATEAGMRLLGEARAVLARHDEAVATMTGYSAPTSEVLRIGVPLELPGDLLTNALTELGQAYPDTRVRALHLSTAAQLEALERRELDLGLLRQRPMGDAFDAMLVVEERLGVLVATERAEGLVGPEGIRLDALSGLDWIGFPRAGSPAWYDELAAILRSHGLTVGSAAAEAQSVIAEVKFAAVTAGRAFAFAPPDWSLSVPETVTWLPLVGHPIVRRTWAVWDAHSTRRDLGHLIAALEVRGPR